MGSSRAVIQAKDLENQERGALDLFPEKVWERKRTRAGPLPFLLCPSPHTSRSPPFLPFPQPVTHLCRLSLRQRWGRGEAGRRNFMKWAGVSTLNGKKLLRHPLPLKTAPSERIIALSATPVE